VERNEEGDLLASSYLTSAARTHHSITSSTHFSSMEAGPLRVGVAVGAADTISGATAQRESPPVVASNKRPRRTSFLSPPERVPSPVKTLERQISLQEDTAVALDGASSVTGARSRGGARQSLSSTRRSLASAPVPPPSESRPWVQADFEVGHALGKGKFGNVYFAKEKASKVHVALKVQFKSALTSGGTQTLANFRREVEIHTRLHHPGLLTMYGYFHDAKVMERCPPCSPMLSHAITTYVFVCFFKRVCTLYWNTRLAGSCTSS
jgi:hypothetical protein